jgi:hypothetical protein
MAVNAGADAVDPERRFTKRDVRALTEYMVAVETDSPGLWEVYAEDGENIYTVDVWTGVCDCPDMEYHDPDGGCKHVRRVRIRTGEVEIPEFVERDAVDSNLLRAVETGGDSA